MKPAAHALGLFCLVAAVCLVICMGCSAPSLGLAASLEAAAETPAMIFFTPEPEAVGSVEEVQPPGTDSEAAAVESPEPDSTAPAMIFFTPTAEQTGLLQSPGDAGTPASQLNTPGAQFTRVALDLTPSATLMPMPSGAAAASSATIAPQGVQDSGGGPIATWPKGWGLAVGLVVVVIVILVGWFVFGRRG
jgi:hypothetical protein